VPESAARRPHKVPKTAGDYVVVATGGHVKIGNERVADALVARA
jgi:hypothetical protein